MDPRVAGEMHDAGSRRPLQTHLLTPEREPEAALLLARAFSDNPINCAVIGGDERRRLRVNGYGMEAALAASRRFSYRRLGVEEGKSQGNSDPCGVLLALEAGGYPVAAPPLRVQLRCLLGQGFRVMLRFGELYRVLDERHPKGPHAYLSLIATAPESRGRGYGRDLLGAWLRDVDAQGWESYLETDRRELLGFYQSAGFEVAGELRAFGTPIWCMHRPAHPRKRQAGDEIHVR